MVVVCPAATTADYDGVRFKSAGIDPPSKKQLHVTVLRPSKGEAAESLFAQKVFSAGLATHYQPKGDFMTKSMRALLVGAALTGFAAGTNVKAQDTQTGDKDKQTKTDDAGKKASKDKIPKHACKGQNACKGQGGGPNAGKNECKGQGGCRTDGKKPQS